MRPTLARRDLPLSHAPRRLWSLTKCPQPGGAPEKLAATAAFGTTETEFGQHAAHTPDPPGQESRRLPASLLSGGSREGWSGAAVIRPQGHCAPHPPWGEGKTQRDATEQDRGALDAAPHPAAVPEPQDCYW